MNLNRKPLSRVKGSSSVLIIMIMLFLVTLGVLVLISSRSNYLLSQKNASWVKDYYRLESIANEHRYEVSKYIENTANLKFKSLLDIELNYFKVDLEGSKENEDGSWTLAYISSHPQLDRNFYTELKIVLKNNKYDIYNTAWIEKPTVFEYEDSLEFEDIGG